MASYPQSEDPLVQAVQRLLNREGGHIAVGEKAGIGDQSLYQIAEMKPDSKTGKPRGVGPSIRKRLDKHYPGWLGPTPHSSETANAPAPRPSTLAEQLVDAIAAMQPARWRSVRAQLDELAGHPEMRDDVLAELQTLLSAPPGKQQGAA